MEANKMISHYAEIYDRYKDQYDDILPETISELHSYVRREFMLIPCNIRFVDKELNDLAEVKRLLVAEKTLYISSLHNNSRLFPGDLNLAFRAIHDATHLGKMLPFTYEGEYKVWEIQSKGMSYQARQVLFSEIVLQTAYSLHFDRFAEDQKIVLIDINTV